MKVLFVLDAYVPRPTATGICVLHVQEALMELGISSDVIMQGEKEGFVEKNAFGNVYSIKGSITYELKIENRFKNEIRKTLLFFSWPVKHPYQIFNYMKMIRILDNKEHYDGIFGVVLPIETVLACSTFDRFFIYEMDSITNNPDYRRGIKKYLQHRTKWIEQFLYSKAKGILHLKCAEKYYSTKQYSKYKYKSEYVDIPHLICTNSVQETDQNKQLSLIYTGALFKSYRSPEYLIKVLIELSKDLVIHCDFYSRGDCEDIIREAERLHERTIKHKGYVDLETIQMATEHADYLLSIGNSLQGEDMSLPSKVISYIASGKPIIHIDGGKNDIAKEYLKKYPLEIIISPQTDISLNVKKIKEFINQTRGKRVSFKELEQIYFMNTPEYSAKIIKMLLLRNI